jgi:SNF family Na+-dependent transporter
MSSNNPFKNALVRDAILVPLLDAMTGFYGGFAIFGVLGHMYLSKCVESFSEVAADGPELAFVVYPEGLSLMGSIAPLFSVLFFFMMLLLGLGSQVLIISFYF